jgi:hypothetical protein
MNYLDWNGYNLAKENPLLITALIPTAKSAGSATPERNYIRKGHYLNFTS